MPTYSIYVPVGDAEILEKNKGDKTLTQFFTDAIHQKAENYRKALNAEGTPIVRKELI